MSKLSVDLFFFFFQMEKKFLKSESENRGNERVREDIYFQNKGGSIVVKKNINFNGFLRFSIFIYYEIVIYRIL